MSHYICSSKGITLWNDGNYSYSVTMRTFGGYQIIDVITGDIEMAIEVYDDRIKSLLGAEYEN